MSLDVLSVIPKDEVTGIVDITQILRPEGLSGNRKIIVAVFFFAEKRASFQSKSFKIRSMPLRETGASGILSVFGRASL